MIKSNYSLTNTNNQRHYQYTTQTHNDKEVRDSILHITKITTNIDI